MDTIFTNSGNSKTSHPLKLLLHLSDKINLTSNIHEKNIKKSYKKNEF